MADERFKTFPGFNGSMLRENWACTIYKIVLYAAELNCFDVCVLQLEIALDPRRKLIKRVNIFRKNHNLYSGFDFLVMSVNRFLHAYVLNFSNDETLREPIMFCIRGRR